MMARCDCGKELDTTSAANIPRVSQYDSKGNLIFSVCMHGHIIVDKLRDTEKT
jgi:hypothetical protein